MEKRAQDEKDIAFSERALSQIQDAEHETGGPRFPDDIVAVVRNLVTATSNVQQAQEKSNATMDRMGVIVDKLVTALEGKGFGDRTDGVFSRLVALEQKYRLIVWATRGIFVMVSLILGKVGWNTWHEVAQYLTIGH